MWGQLRPQPAPNGDPPLVAMTVVLLLVVIVVLVWTRPTDRDYSLGLALLIGAFTWLAIRIHLLHILGDLFAVALEHWTEIVMAFGTAVVLIVPAIMIHIAVHDRLENRAIRQEFRESHGTVRTKFNQRVAQLRSLGYDRDRAEAAALRLLKKG